MHHIVSSFQLLKEFVAVINNISNMFPKQWYWHHGDNLTPVAWIGAGHQSAQ